jgi:CHAD domain-containing protein
LARAREVRGLSCDESFRTAAGKIIWTRFEEMMSFRDLVSKPGKGTTAEDVIHDMRVASRRLRAALEQCSDVFPRKQYRPMLKAVKRLADSLGEVRDLDVMIERLARLRSARTPAQKIVLHEMIEEMQSRRKQARRDLEATIDELERADFPRRFTVFVAQETI